MNERIDLDIKDFDLNTQMCYILLKERFPQIKDDKFLIAYLLGYEDGHEDGVNYETRARLGDGIAFLDEDDEDGRSAAGVTTCNI